VTEPRDELAREVARLWREYPEDADFPGLPTVLADALDRLAEAYESD